MHSRPFISFDLRQPINQWIALAFVALLCFWVVLYYMVHRAEAFGEIIILNAGVHTETHVENLEAR